MEQLGALIGTTKQTIQRYESGEIKNVPYDKILEIAKVLLITPGELMGISKAESSTSDMTDILIAKELSTVDPDKKAKILEIVKQLAKAEDKELNAVSELLDLIIKE